MKKYWFASNADFAEQSVLHMILGTLEFYEEEGMQVDPAELKDYIYKKVAETRKRLDTDFPDYASE